MKYNTLVQRHPHEAVRWLRILSFHHVIDRSLQPISQPPPAMENGVQRERRTMDMRKTQVVELMGCGLLDPPKRWLKAIDGIDYCHSQ